MQPLPQHSPLERVVREVESHVARSGWDQPTRLFALVDTAAAIADDPSLAAVLDKGPDGVTYTAVEQEGLPEHDTIQGLLEGISFGEKVDGALIVVERMMVPPEAEVGLPEDREEALELLMEHPGREDIRLVASALRTGESMCAIRARSKDSDVEVATGPDLSVGLVMAVADTLLEDGARGK